jgi:hypothetical protein
VAINQVNIVQLESLQGGVHALHDVLPTQTLLVQTLPTPTQFRRDDDVGPVPQVGILGEQLAVRLSENPFRLPLGIAVRFGVVEQVDPTLPGYGQYALGLVHPLAVQQAALDAEGGPEAEPKNGRDDSRVADGAIVHRWRSRHGFLCHASRENESIQGMAPTRML